ncbi:MAG: endonuclease III, partial [Prevotella sp.]|nr:endonuclease III [Prevotella sp.]
MKRSELYNTVFTHFRKEHPIVDTELHYSSTYQLLVAVVLSAQCTDKRVNLVTPALFRAYPDAQSMAAASEADVYQYIRSISYPNAKARHLVELSQILHEKYHGEVPSDMDSLLQL